MMEVPYNFHDLHEMVKYEEYSYVLMLKNFMQIVQ